MKNPGYMLTKWFLLIIVCCAFTKFWAQSSDGLRLNIRLYPAQVLSINTDASAYVGNTQPLSEFKWVAISSPSGFQVKVYDEDLHHTSHLESSSGCYHEYNLINQHKGVVQRVFDLHENIEKVMKNLGCESQGPSKSWVVTLISQ